MFYCIDTLRSEYTGQDSAGKIFMEKIKNFKKFVFKRSVDDKSVLA